MRIVYIVEMRLEITLSMIMRIAFIKGGSIYDNTIMAHEVYISYHEAQIRKGSRGNQIGHEKGLWPYGVAISFLKFFHNSVHSKWTNLVGQCITTTFFSILLNRSHFCKFKGSKGRDMEILHIKLLTHY